MMYTDKENQVTDAIIFNLQISISDAKRLLDPEYLTAPEGEREDFGPFAVGIFSNNLSMIGYSYEFIKTDWWKEIKNNLEVDIDASTDIWTVTYIDF